MQFAGRVADPTKTPGASLAALETALRDDPSGLLSPAVERLSEQPSVVEENLPRLLTNIADSGGARRVVERFYREHHGRSIDASDPEALGSEITDLESVVHGDALPIFSKTDLRRHYGVEGAWGEVVEHQRPHLAPEWVVEHEEEPYTVNKTSGTTGTPWERAMTRNDVALPMACLARSVVDVLRREGRDPSEMTTVNPFPEPASRGYISRTFECLGADVLTLDYERLRGSGQQARATVDEMLDVFSAAEFCCLTFPVRKMLEGPLGVEIRRGNVDIDLVFNGGAPFSERQEEIVRSSGAEIVDVYGETEYPEYAIRSDESGRSGYRLPLDAQVNLVYDSGNGELSYEGIGRFAYFPFGIEGQAIPGVYLSDVNCEIVRTRDDRQILKNVERVGNDDSCSAIR